MERKVMKERLQEVCKSLGISMRQLALKSGYSEAWSNSIKNSITSTAVNKILSAYPMVNKDYLLFGSGQPILDDTDTLSLLPDTYQPDADNYKELCMAYRQDLAEARNEIKNLREAYFLLMETNNKLMANLAALQAASLRSEAQTDSPFNLESKKA